MSDTYFGGYLDVMIDSEADVLAIRAKAMENYRKGVLTLEWSGEGTEGKREFVAPVQDILRETRLFLKTKNPGRYGSIVRQSQVLRLA